MVDLQQQIDIVIGLQLTLDASILLLMYRTNHILKRLAPIIRLAESLTSHQIEIAVKKLKAWFEKDEESTAAKVAYFGEQTMVVSK